MESLLEQPVHSFKIAFLLSGSGSTLENLLNHIASGHVRASVSVVISSRENVYGLKIAQNWNIPHHTIPYIQYKNDIQTYSQRITSIIDQYNIQLIVFGGFMSKYIVPEKYYYKVINIHPALVPSFSGLGYYGIKVHKSVIEQGVKITGCTVHFVDNQYDHGAIIEQESIRVLVEDTPETLQDRVKKLEQSVYPNVIQKIVENKFIIQNGRVSEMK